jgi:twitching motility protein PilT
MKGDAGTGHPPLEELLREAADRGASDLHLSAGCPPLLRVDGVLQPTTHPELSPDQCVHLCGEALPPCERGEAAACRDRDLALTLTDGTRFRGTLFRQRDSLAATFRAIPTEPPSLATLGLPATCRSIVAARDGLVLVTGSTGSGKSTTLAAMIAEIRARRGGHVLTIEDPIEFVHPPGPGLITQREVGRDTPSFAAALRQALRQDPDVVLVGELRDGETMRAALTLAETGHLVLSTLHSTSALEAADRIVDAFPADEQAQTRKQIASVLHAVVAQKLVPRRDGAGRVAACEILIATPAVRNLIREGKAHQIASLLQAGRSAHGMQTMADGLAELVQAGVIDARAAAEAR